MAAKRRTPRPMTTHTERSEPAVETFDGAGEPGADDGVLHALGELSPSDAAALAAFKADDDPGAGEAVPEP